MEYPQQDDPREALNRFVDQAYRDQDGNVLHDNLYWSSHSIRSDRVGAAAATYKSIKILAARLDSEMPKTIADVLRPQILGMAEELSMCVAGKDSESIHFDKDGNNPSSVNSLRNDIGKVTTSHIYSTPHEAAKGILDRLRGDNNQERGEAMR